MVLKLTDSPCFEAGDRTLLRELLHPAKINVGTTFSMAHAYLKPGTASLPHRLKSSSETYFFLKGKGEISIDGVLHQVDENDTVFVPANAVQFVRNVGNNDLVFLCVVSPPWAAEDEEILV